MYRILLILGVAVSLSSAQKEILIDLSNQTAKALDNEKVVFSGAISSGMKGRETPGGNFKITQKKVKHRSNLWPKPKGGARMPYMMRLNRSPITLHLGNLPGYPASHGCVRLEDGFAQKLYKWTPMHTKVKIIGKTPSRRNFTVKNVTMKSSKKRVQKKTYVSREELVEYHPYDYDEDRYNPPKRTRFAKIISFEDKESEFDYKPLKQ